MVQCVCSVMSSMQELVFVARSHSSKVHYIFLHNLGVVCYSDLEVSAYDGTGILVGLDVGATKVVWKLNYICSHFFSKSNMWRLKDLIELICEGSEIILNWNNCRSGRFWACNCRSGRFLACNCRSGRSILLLRRYWCHLKIRHVTNRVLTWIL